MSFLNNLFNFLQNIPTDTKEEILSNIHRGSPAKNAKNIYQWLKENGYQKRDQGYSVDHIKEFISNTLYGEYIPERIPEYDNKDELKQLELMREAIDERNRELQQKEILEQPIWEHQQQEQHRLTDNYDDLYINHVEEWNKCEGEQHKLLKVKNIVQSLHDNPFDKTVDLKSLDIDECQKITPMLKKWYEDKIKNKEIKDKIAIVMTVNNEEIF